MSEIESSAKTPRLSAKIAEKLCFGLHHILDVENYDREEAADVLCLSSATLERLLNKNHPMLPTKTHEFLRLMQHELPMHTRKEIFRDLYDACINEGDE